MVWQTQLCKKPCGRQHERKNTSSVSLRKIAGVKGPPFLHLPANHWPKAPEGKPPEEAEELKKTVFCGLTSKAAGPPVPDIQQFSTYQELMDATTQHLHEAASSTAKPDADDFGHRISWCLSGQGTNFKGGGRELHETSIKATTSREEAEQIQFRLHPPNAPHFSGAWDREVRSVKTALRTMLGDQTVTEEVLRTVLVEVKGILNSKPLGYVSSDVADPDHIAPNSLLMGGRTPPRHKWSDQNQNCLAAKGGDTPKSWPINSGGTSYNISCLPYKYDRSGIPRKKTSLSAQ
ncbi:hypothetical protein F2P81_015903 [Scophthalmus maximus]|uniref:Uncharacterized protein n=1 Tax=Scophthalmus maximus TaxID=52904 RepID=A0A6A4SGK7_SCOMX|nr:hypothetical protein F2P81_015903 [Scophthalmus maximus]